MLVSPLDWGLGHATRCVPIVNALLHAGADVKLAGFGASIDLLASYFPALEVRELPGYDIRFKSFWSLLPQLPGIFSTIQKEYTILDSWIKEGWVDAVVSDNRYGLNHPDIPSVMICHQLAPIPPFGGGAAHAVSFRLHRQYLNRFDEIWIPDVAGSPNLSGKLSHDLGYQGPLRWLGPLSRFELVEKSTDAPQFDIVALISGPEPQRSRLERILTQHAEGLDQSTLLIQGKPGNPYEHKKGNLSVINFLDGAALAGTLHRAGCVVARPGYSSLMDFASLGLERLILVPTPGQTEQKYLASRLHQEGRIWKEKQATLNLKQAIRKVEGCKALQTAVSNKTMLADEVNRFVRVVVNKQTLE